MHNWKRTFWAIWVAEIIAISGFGTTTPIIPLYIQSLGVTDTASLNFWTGLTNTGAALIMALMAPIWGSLADSYGRKLMLLRAMFGGAVLFALMSFTTEPWQVATLRTLQGAVTGTVAAATVFTASISPPAEAGFRLGLMQMAIYLGNSIGPLIGGVLADLFGFRTNFLVTSGLLLVAGVLVTKGAHEEFVPKPRSGSLLRNAIPDFGPIRRTPALRTLFGVVFSVQMAAAIIASMLTLFIMDLTGGEEGVASMAGSIIAAGSVAGALAAAVIGKVSGRFGYGRTLVVCMAGSAFFYLLQSFVSSPIQLLWLRIGSGIFLGGTMPSVNALIARLTEAGRQGSTYGLSSSIANAGAALGPALGAVLATTTGYRSVFAATAFILGTMGWFAARSTTRDAGYGPGTGTAS